MAQGMIERDGNMTITLNVQAEKLLAPGGGHYLPCEWCGKVEEVPINVVAHSCQKCNTCSECGGPNVPVKSASQDEHTVLVCDKCGAETEPGGYATA